MWVYVSVKLLFLVFLLTLDKTFPSPILIILFKEFVEVAINADVTAGNATTAPIDDGVATANTVDELAT